VNRTRSLSVFVVVLAGCSWGPATENDVKTYAFLDPATGITYNVPLRFNLSTGLASLAHVTSSAQLDEYVGDASEGARTARGDTPTTVALLARRNAPNAVQDVPTRIALVESSHFAESASMLPVSMKVAEAAPASLASRAPEGSALNLKLDTEFASAKRLIRFAAGAKSLGPSGKLAVAELLPWAKQAEKVHVRGGADSSGNAVHNRELAMARATAVSAAFISGGVDQQKIAKSYCVDCYVASNTTMEGRRLNRRVDVELVLKQDIYAQLPAPVHAPKVPESLPLIQASALR
jgi:outer membrane protein OmpA-like peptidoglycan-associated protein